MEEKHSLSAREQKIIAPVNELFLPFAVWLLHFAHNFKDIGVVRERESYH